MKFNPTLIALLGICLAIVMTTNQHSLLAQETDKITFDDHIGPLLRKRCSSCHNPNKKSSDLDVTSLSNLMEGGASGEGIQPGDSESTYLYTLVTHEDSPEMPPGNKIPENEIGLIKKWIDGGALENKGSKAVIKPKFDMAMSESPTSRPEVTPMPPRLPLQPVIRTGRGSVTALATSPWAPITAVASPKQVLLYNTQAIQLVGVLPFPEGQANVIRFSRNGSVLMAAGGVNGAKGFVVLWNVKTGEQIGQLGDELDAILAADISPDQSMIAIGGSNKTVKVLSTADGSELYEIKKHTDWVSSLEFSPDGKYLATADRNGGLHLWYAEDGSEHLTLKAHTKMINALSWRIDGKVLASAGEDNTVRIWESENGKQIKNWGTHAPGVTSIEFASDGNLVTCGRDKLVRHYKQDGGQLKQFGGLTDVAVAVSYCDESKRVISGDWNGTIKVWNPADGKLIGEMSPNPPTLQEHLQWAQNQVKSHQTAHSPLAAKVAELTKITGELTGSLQQAKQQQQSKTAEMKTLQGQIANTQKQLDSTLAEQNQWRQELAEKNGAKPLVVQSHKSAAEAATKLPNDAEMKTAAEQLAKKVQQLDQRIGELNGLVAQSDQRKATTQTQLGTFKQTLATLTSEVNAINQQVSQLEKEVGQNNDALVKTQNEEAAAKKKVDDFNRLVSHWNNEIAFVDQLKTLKSEIAAARKVEAEKAALAIQAEEKLKAVEQQATFAKNVQSEAQQKVEALNQKLKALKNVQ